MRFHPTGIKPVIVLLAGVLTILLFINMLFPVQSIVHMILYAVATVFMFLVIRFFRFPSRNSVIDQDIVYSGADGKVVAIEKVHVPEYFDDERIQVSVFMTPVNVHVNWSPVGGQIVYRKYHKGKFLVAFNPKSSLVNEHTSFVIRDLKDRDIMVRQIAGAMARRIILVPEEGSMIGQGEYIGIIKFGSRVDIMLPADAKILVKIGDKAVATHTVMAKLT
ncbi:MAG: phosphatidylserine decarboxylase family protein [Bacteroidales bacterium]|nr:phosphatidylserine decarboxylase family protein [Bacteroidales bacterium]